jgi:hypothetical protein
MAQPDQTSLTLRIQVAEMWDAIRVVASPGTPLVDVKRRVVEEFALEYDFLDEFVLKIRGWEMLNERLSLAESGVVDGSILLLAYRRRRPVR